MKPKVNRSIVIVAIPVAGLKPGKNLRTPNHKKTIPRLTLRKRIP
jgi:hypothetical protein